MKKRNPIAVALLPLVTFGIYGIYWYVKTKGEMNAKGAAIPTAWLLIVPIANVYWLWKYSEAVEHVTNGKLQGIAAFLLFAFVAPVGLYLVQENLNELDAEPADNAPSTPYSAEAIPPETPPAHPEPTPPELTHPEPTPPVVTPPVVTPPSPPTPPRPPLVQ